MKEKLLVSVIILLLVAVLYCLRMPCVFLELTGVPCLGCGMTRALIAALQLNIQEAFSHHLMFWSVPLLYICFLRDGKLFQRKSLNILFYIVIFAGYVVNWHANWHII